MLDTLFLIAGGTMLLGYSAYSTANLLKTVDLQQNAFKWKLLYLLMICFFCGYLGVIVLILADMQELFFSLAGLVFFFGALFVLIVARIGCSTIYQLEAAVRQRTTELRKAKEKTEEYSRQKSNFLAVMSHEIRTPLHSVIATTDLLADTHLNRDQQLYISILKRAGQSLLAQVNDVLDISKIEAGKLKLEKSPFFPLKMVRNTVKIMKVRARQRNLYFHTDLNIAEDVSVLGDAVKLEQVLMNLISNALKFTLQGGITLRASLEQQRDRIVSLRFSVADTGVGFSEDKKKQIFESFAQSESSTSRRFGGTGLGLTICKNLVELMGGHIEAESAYGQGSRFYFTVNLPLLTPQEVKAAQKIEKPLSQQLREATFYPNSSRGDASRKRIPQKRALKETRVLIVEDNQENRILFNAFLKDTGVKLDAAENGQAAVGMACSRDYDLILMDIQMPIKDGFAATKEIRAFEKAQRTGRTTPIVALSASATSEDILRARSCGCSDYLSKPINKATLIAAIDRYGRNRPTR